MLRNKHLIQNGKSLGGGITNKQTLSKSMIFLGHNVELENVTEKKISVILEDSG